MRYPKCPAHRGNVIDVITVIGFVILVLLWLYFFCTFDPCGLHFYPVLTYTGFVLNFLGLRFPPS